MIMNSLQNSIGPLLKSAAFELSFRLRLPQASNPKACVALRMGSAGPR